MTQPPDALVTLGVVVRAHGLRGEVRVKPWNPDSRLWPELEGVVLVAPDGTRRPAALVAVRGDAESPILVFDGVSTREAAEALRGTEIAVPRTSLPAPDEDEVYLADLEGLEVRDGDRVLGVVRGFFEYPSVDCLRVEGEDGVRELPLLETYLVEIDVDAGVIRARATDELPVEPLRPTRARRGSEGEGA